MKLERAPATTRWHIDTTPLAASLRRALLESVLGGLILVALVGTIGRGLGVDPAGFAGKALGWLWLVFWPAWRLRPAVAHGWLRRAGVGLLRLVLLGFILGVIWSVFDAFLQLSLFSGAASGQAPFPAYAGPMIFLLIAVRVPMLVVAALIRRIRRRLRWQLISSHLAVILLTFVSLTGVGSAIAAGLVLHWAMPNAVAMASSAARVVAALPSVRQTDNLRGGDVQASLYLIASQRYLLDGEPPIAVFPQMTFIARPAEILVVDRGGAVLAAAEHMMCSPDRAAPATPVPPRSVLKELAGIAFSGGTRTLSLTFGSCPSSGRIPHVLAAAAVRPSGASVPIGAVVVAAPEYNLLANQYTFPGAVAIFGVTTALLLAAWLVPSLVISGGVGYMLARGLTRRLEAVSRVTTAIASGNLTLRVPVKTTNEIGQLADNVNRMADHLETTMGALQAARYQAEQSLQQRQELVANISHELRTPLAIVQAHLETLLVDQAPRPEAGIVVPAGTLRALQNETERLSSLVDDLFSLSRAQSGALHIQSAEVDVGAVVDDVAALMRPLAQAEGMIALTVETPPGLPPALADGDRLRQIIANLVRNAIRHTPDGGIIVLGVASEEQWIVVSVADTGEGIAPEHLPYIFDRFYRVDQSRGRAGGGAGLGLAIVRELVELMGGRVEVESTLGEGSCFRVYLPRAARPSGVQPAAVSA